MATNPTTPDEQMEKEMMSMLQDTMSNLRSDSPAISLLNTSFSGKGGPYLVLSASVECFQNTLCMGLFGGNDYFTQYEYPTWAMLTAGSFIEAWSRIIKSHTDDDKDKLADFRVRTVYDNGNSAEYHITNYTDIKSFFRRCYEIFVEASIIIDPDNLTKETPKGASEVALYFIDGNTNEILTTTPQKILGHKDDDGEFHIKEKIRFI